MNSLFVTNTAERYFVITVDAVLSFLLVFDTAAVSCYSFTCVSDSLSVFEYYLSDRQHGALLHLKQGNCSY